MYVYEVWHLNENLFSLQSETRVMAGEMITVPIGLLKGVYKVHFVEHLTADTKDPNTLKLSYSRLFVLKQ